MSGHPPYGSVYANPGGGVPQGELIFISVLLVLSLLAVGIEVLRKLSGRSYLSGGQFWLRMGGGAVMLVLVGLITFGALFVRPQDGRIFAWFWAFCSLVLLIVVLILRIDVAWTRTEVRDQRLRMRDERLQEVREIIERHRATVSAEPGDHEGSPPAAALSPPDDPPGS
ncbi:MAG: hypothetical protein LC772_01420 [Chloroflexi bacterium]|nr:hypothetical protein [Chloroflexota bacterium]